MDFLIHHMLRTSAHHLADKEALVHGEQRLTYREVAKRCSGLARGLRSGGSLRGDRIGIYLEPSVAQVVSIFGVSEAGGVFVPINATLFPEQVGHIAKDCGMKGLITTPAKFATLSALLQNLPALKFVILTGEGSVPVRGPRVSRPSFEDAFSVALRIRPSRCVRETSKRSVGILRKASDLVLQPSRGWRLTFWT